MSCIDLIRPINYIIEPPIIKLKPKLNVLIMVVSRPTKSVVSWMVSMTIGSYGYCSMVTVN